MGVGGMMSGLVDGGHAHAMAAAGGLVGSGEMARIDGRKRPHGNSLGADGDKAAKRTHAKQAASRTSSGGGDDDGENSQRVSWSSHEDQVIVKAVQELGPRWTSVAARLPSRTDQAVRNRWNRLQQRARVQARTMLTAFQPRPPSLSGPNPMGE